MLIAELRDATPDRAAVRSWLVPGGTNASSIVLIARVGLGTFSGNKHAVVWSETVRIIE